jgi:molecular chaperone GrpE (heat shock protein)
MDDKIRRAEELLEQRSRERGGNGHAKVDTDAPAAEQPPATSPADQRAEELTNDLKRMAADFANYRKRNEAERTEFS